MNFLNWIRDWMSGPSAATPSVRQAEARERARELEPSYCDNRACYVLDKYDDPIVYRVLGAPSANAAQRFMMWKLRRPHGEALRDWPVNRLDELPIKTVRYLPTTERRRRR